MANKDWAFGLAPQFTIGGGSPRTERYPLKSAYTTKIYKGAPVLWDNTNAVVKANAVTNSATIVGVAAEYYAGSATTKTTIAVWPGDEHIFLVQSDGTTTTSALTSVQHKNFAFVNQTAGSTITGLSGLELDFSSGTSADKPLHVIGLGGEIGEAAGANMKLLVRFNSGHLYNQTSVGP